MYGTVSCIRGRGRSRGRSRGRLAVIQLDLNLEIVGWRHRWAMAVAALDVRQTSC